VRLYTRADSTFRPVRIGDSLSFIADLQETRNTSNPKSFRYDRYLNNLGIWYTAFLEDEDFYKGGDTGKFPLRRLAAQAQGKMVNTFQTSGIAGEELAIISALVAGDRTLIDEELNSDYAIAGAMHILAVSGLHVGILYLFLQLFLFRNNNLPVFRISRMLIVICTLWVYAFITGLSPSVMRASLMFSLFQLGKGFDRPVSGLNMLAASAFVILVINPLDLFQPGFQFSYLAVLGILVFQPVVGNLMVFRYALPDRIWQITALSLSVQVTTLPLVLYYFNQFPTYFLLSNIVVIPLVWLIMTMSIGFFVFLPFSVLTPILVWVLKFLIHLMNCAVQWLSDLPFSALTGIRFTSLHLVVLYMLILSVMFNASRARFGRLIRTGLLILSSIIFIDCIIYRVGEKRKEVVVYHSNRNLIISLIEGHRHLALALPSDSASLEQDLLYLEKFWLLRQLGNQQWVRMDSIGVGKGLKGDTFELYHSRDGFSISFCDRNYFYPERRHYTVATDSLPRINAMIIGRGSPGPDDLPLDKLQVSEIVLCKSAYRNVLREWREFAGQNDIQCFDIQTRGAYMKRVHR
jgi:competence protein ComEC